MLVFLLNCIYLLFVCIFPLFFFRVVSLAFACGGPQFENPSDCKSVTYEDPFQ